MVAAGGHPLFAALYAWWLSPVIEASPIGAARRTLLEQAHGVVVDLGAGTGANLAHLPGAVTHTHLVEPDPHMLRRLPADVSARPDQVTVHRAGAEDLPLPSASVDTVVTTLTLCTVGDPTRAVAEMRRVLRPGGQVLVLEHVRAGNALLALGQRLSARPWSLAGGGCRLDRDTAGELAAAGFATDAVRRFRVPGLMVVSDWIVGRAVLADPVA